MLLVQPWAGGGHCLHSPCHSLGVTVPPLPPCPHKPHCHGPQGGQGSGVQAAPWGRVAAPMGGGSQLPLVQPPPNKQGCLAPNVFQPRPQANFNFLVIMQMNVDLIKGRFH